MLPLIAWRNIWRSRTRSLVVITSVVLGIWAGTFIMSFSFGMSDQYVRSAINGQISHIQIHDPAYIKDKESKFGIAGAEALEHQITSLPEVQAVCSRFVTSGMASSTNTGLGVNISGVIPENENAVTGLAGKIVEGAYFDGSKHNQVIISQRLAEKLHVELNKKIVLTFQDVHGNITSGAFRISGLYATTNSAFDDIQIFTIQKDMFALTGSDAPDEIAVLLKADGQTASVQEKIQQLAPSLTVETWRQIAPELSLVIDSFGQYMYLFIAIILLALGFGIVNVMLMAVLERVREIGMLMAIGMNKTRVFFMIMLETMYLALVGGPLGLLLAWGSISYFHTRGINLSMFSQGLQSYGMDSLVYTDLLTKYYVDILIMIFITAVLAAIYPARKALQLKPSKAIQKI